MAKTKKKAYARAGVDVDLGNLVKRRIQSRVKSTHGPEVLGKIGGFGGLFAPNFSGMSQPVLVASVKLRHNLLFEQGVERLGFGEVLFRLLEILLARKVDAQMK